MELSQEFQKFGSMFIQDLDLLGDNLDELLESVLSPFKGEARVRLRAFLNEAISPQMSDMELQKLWNAAPSDIFFRDADDLRAMLKAARDRL